MVLGCRSKHASHFATPTFGLRSNQTQRKYSTCRLNHKRGSRWSNKSPVGPLRKLSRSTLHVCLAQPATRRSVPTSPTPRSCLRASRPFFLSLSLHSQPRNVLPQDNFPQPAPVGPMSPLLPRPFLDPPLPRPQLRIVKSAVAQLRLLYRTARSSPVLDSGVCAAVCAPTRTAMFV